MLKRWLFAKAQVRAKTVWACNAAIGEPAPISWGTTPSR